MRVLWPQPCIVIILYYETETESIFGLHDSYITDDAGNGASS